MGCPGDSDDRRDILFEFTAIGTSMRVTAIDARTGTEVVVQGRVNASRHDLQRIAQAKLLYVLNKKSKEG